MNYTRKKFLSTISVGTTGILLGTNLYAKPTSSFEEEPLKKELVKKFVGKAHSDLDTVKKMLTEFPTLLNAAWDWKGGDFETALGAACHVGHKKLASFLIDNGAQANIFTACLFGNIEIVKPMIMAFPNTINAVGPHGFSLLHHAKQGGEEALEVKEFLLKSGVKKTKFDLSFPK